MTDPHIVFIAIAMVQRDSGNDTLSIAMKYNKSAGVCVDLINTGWK
jgi:hypothetical protein